MAGTDGGGRRASGATSGPRLAQAFSRVFGRAFRRKGLRLAALGLLGLAVLAITSCASVNPHYRSDRPHHRPHGFVNNYGVAGGKPLPELLTWFWQRNRDGLPKPPSTFVEGYGGFPVVKPAPAAPAAAPDALTVTWIGHATLLVQIGGLNVLTDPQFSDRAFPVQWAGPKRRVPLPARLEELPRIDLVIVSHNHYDHLDLDTVRALERQAGGPPVFAAPLGIDRWLRAQGATRVERFDWWESRRIGGVEVHSVPVQHWCARSLWDRNESLWSGWVLKAGARSVYFSGDTGYSKDFADTQARLGPVELALLPVGAYEPRWFMKDQHVNPDEAVKIHRDLRARLSIGMHWGTFELTDEPLDQPIGDLAKALDAAGEPRDRFVLLKHGETRVIPPAP